MLVISRREGEEVVIGDPANPTGIVRVISINGDKIRLGFEFPREVDVHRGEVADAILSQSSGSGDGSSGGSGGGGGKGLLYHDMPRGYV